MRTIQLVGRVYKNRKLARLARKCAWCGRWATAEDFIAAHRDNAKVTHGMCDPCAKRWLGDAGISVTSCRPQGPDGEAA